ncbi:MAG: LysE family transporter [Bacteroidia bacterium]|nr:LysE family transporter [Bacteroidia bacterium]
MGIMIFIKGIILGFSASLPLGPIGLICIQKTLNKGRWAGMVSGAGAATSDTFFAIIAAFGISFISDFIEQQQFVLRIVGSAILILLGLRIFLTNPAIQIRKQKFKKNNLLADFISIFFLTLSNPVTVFVFGAVFASSGLIKVQNSFFDLVLLVVGVFVGAMFWWLILVNFVNLFRSKFRLKRLWWINKITGAVIVLFGLFVLVATIFFKI